MRRLVMMAMSAAVLLGASACADLDKLGQPQTAGEAPPPGHADASANASADTAKQSAIAGEEKATHKP